METFFQCRSITFADETGNIAKVLMILGLSAESSYDLGEKQLPHIFICFLVL